MENPRIYRFDVPAGEFSEWAVVTITEDGFFNANSDWGDYHHWWGSPGEGRSILDFILSVGDDYLIDKLGYGFPYLFMEEESQALLQKVVSGMRTVDPEDDIHGYNAALEEMADLIQDVRSEEQFYEFVQAEWEDLPGLNFSDLHPVMSRTPMIRKFVERIMPKVRATIKLFQDADYAQEEGVAYAKLSILNPIQISGGGQFQYWQARPMQERKK